MRDRLVELFHKINYQSRENGLFSNLATQFTDFAIEQIADHLIAEGVVMLPCKIGTMVYTIEPLWYGVWGEDEHKCRKCEHFYEGGMGDSPDCSLGKNCCYHIVEEEADLRKIADWVTPSSFTKEIAWGKTVFLTPEEAEAKLREMKGYNNEQRKAD